MSGTLRPPEHVKREVMRANTVKPWEPPPCDICFQMFATLACQKENFGKLEIVEEFHLDGSHVVHIIAPHYVWARLDTMQVMATLDDSTYLDPFKDAVKVLAHLGFVYVDKVITDTDTDSPNGVNGQHDAVSKSVPQPPTRHDGKPVDSTGIPF